MKNWESIFEDQLIPLVCRAPSQTALDACIGLVIDTLFRRPGDDKNKQYFRKVFDDYVGKSSEYSDRLHYAGEFLRMVKGIRVNLASEAAKKAAQGVTVDENHKPEEVSSDLEAMTQAIPKKAPDPAKAPAPAKVPAPEPVAAAEPVPEAPPVTFETIFDDAICAQLREVLAGLACSSPPAAGKLPFVSAPVFAEALEKVVRRFVLPSIRASRNIASRLRDNHLWEAGAERHVVDMLMAGEMNNPILLGWDKRWGEFGGKGAAAGEGKQVWSYFRKHAESNHYKAPQSADLPAILSLPRYSPELLKKAWQALTDHYQQEFDPRPHQTQARDGVLRDSLNKIADGPGMQVHAVEWLSIKASADFGRLRDGWLNDFSKNKGKNAAERARNIPYLTGYLGEG